MSDNLKGLGIQELIKLSETNARQMQIEMAKYDKVYAEVIKNAPEGDIDQLERVKALSNKAISLAKEGKTSEANAVIEEIKNMKK